MAQEMLTSATNGSARLRRPLQLLYLEDTPRDARLSVRQLEQAGFEVDTEIVADAEHFMQALRSKTHDVILADYRVPGWSGIEALEMLQGEGLDIPFILVTGTLGEETAVESIKKGATDYVLKDRLARLPFAVERALEDKKAREERKRDEELLYLRTRALGAAANSVVITDRNGEIIWVNDAFSALTGYSANEVLGGNPRLLKSGKHDAKFYENLWTTVLAGQVWKGEFVNRRKDGTLYVEESTITPVRGQNGEITHLFAIKQDISDRLERRKLEDQLRQSQKMEAIGRLAGGIAHDFNNLLTIIIGHSTLGLDGKHADTPAGHFQEIKSAGDRAAALTRQLLAFSRKQVLQPRVLNLNETVANLDKMLRRIIGEDIELVLNPGRDTGLVKADPSQMEQIIMNLAVNARDAMPHGGKFIIETGNAFFGPMSLPANCTVAPGAYVMLRARDTGCGMDAETQSRIFEPFFTTKGQGEGTGLGLSTVYGIVQQSGGAILVESQPEKGAAFTIYLPQMTGEQEIPQAGVTLAREAKGSGVVLLVEDESALRALVRRILEKGGYTVLEASDANEALRLSAEYERTIDLLLTDMVMPQMSGKQLGERLLRLRGATRVLYMSGYSDEIIAKTGQGQIPEAFIQKPFAPNTLLAAIRQTLESPSHLERRKYHRAACAGTEVCFESGHDEIRAMVGNVSEGGMLLLTHDIEKSSGLGKKARLRFKIAGEPREVSALARVVRVEQAGASSRIAVEFQDLSEMDRAAVRTLAAAQLG